MAEAPLFPGLGTHFVYIYVGSPPQRVSVIVDTGSHYTAFPCKGCHGCGDHTDPYFDLSLSETGNALACGDSKCGNSCRNNQCLFSQAYTEGSSWNAFKVRDNLWVGGESADSLRHFHPQPESLAVDFIFGCQTKETGLFKSQVADGIMGMSKNADTLISQLYRAEMVQRKMFALCFHRVGGTMTLGGVDQSTHTSPLKFTSVSSKSSNGWFAVHVNDIEIGDTPLGAASSKYNSGKGMIVDSGTTDTYLPRTIATRFKEVFNQVAGFSYSSRRMRLTSNQLRDLPDITFKLSNDVDVVMPASAYLGATGGGYYEFRVMLTESSGGVLGANFMRDHDVVFDWENNLMGFASADCAFAEQTRPTEDDDPTVVTHDDGEQEGSGDSGGEGDGDSDGGNDTGGTGGTGDEPNPDDGSSGGHNDNDNDNGNDSGGEDGEGGGEDEGSQDGAGGSDGGGDGGEGGNDGTPHDGDNDEDENVDCRLSRFYPIEACKGSCPESDEPIEVDGQQHWAVVVLQQGKGTGKQCPSPESLPSEQRPCVLSCLGGVPMDTSKPYPCAVSVWGVCQETCSQARLAGWVSDTSGSGCEIKTQTRLCHTGACPIMKGDYSVDVQVVVEGVSEKSWNLPIEREFGRAVATVLRRSPGDIEVVVPMDATGYFEAGQPASRIEFQVRVIKAIGMDAALQAKDLANQVGTTFASELRDALTDVDAAAFPPAPPYPKHTTHHHHEQHNFLEQAEHRALSATSAEEPPLARLEVVSVTTRALVDPGSESASGGMGELVLVLIAVGAVFFAVVVLVAYSRLNAKYRAMTWRTPSLMQRIQERFKNSSHVSLGRNGHVVTGSAIGDGMSHRRAEDEEHEMQPLAAQDTELDEEDWT